MTYHHVLAAFDGSKASVKALDYAIRLVESKPGSRLTVVHVESRPSYLLTGYGMILPESYGAQIAEHQQEIVRQAKEKISNLAYAKVIVLDGTPSYAILEHAKANACDLIVIGNRGLGPIREWMLGSVSLHVSQQAQIPVLIVK